MNSEHYTIVVLPSHHSGMRTWRIPAWFLPTVCSAVLVTLALFVVTIAYCYRLAHESAQRETWKEENLHLKQKWQQTQDRIHNLAKILGEVDTLHRELHNISLPATPSDSSAEGALITDPTTLPKKPSPNPSESLRQSDQGQYFSFSKEKYSLSDLTDWALSQKNRLNQIQTYFSQENSLLDKVPATWPIRGWVTSDFGFRLDPFTAERTLHKGIDIAAKHGTPITAPSDGTVLFVGSKNGYGNLLVLEHQNGIKTRYAHLSAIDVHTGQRVMRGEKLGAAGNTGRSTGPHLHYEVLVDGITQNPRMFLLQ